MNTIEKRLTSIEQRNARVEQDKAWEVSLLRRISITSLTYVTVLVYLFMIHNDSPFINAVVPAAGYLLSMLALKEIRDAWAARQKKR